MSAFQAFKAARDAGVRICVYGGRVSRKAEAVAALTTFGICMRTSP